MRNNAESFTLKVLTWNSSVFSIGDENWTVHQNSAVVLYPIFFSAWIFSLGSDSYLFFQVWRHGFVHNVDGRLLYWISKGGISICIIVCGPSCSDIRPSENHTAMCQLHVFQYCCDYVSALFNVSVTDIHVCTWYQLNTWTTSHLLHNYGPCTC